jgi:hypothetical protein
MDKNGIRNLQLVLVSQDIDGMDNTVKSPMFVRMEEFGIQPTNNVSVQMDHIGQDLVVYQHKNALVVNILILLSKNVLVMLDSTGMENNVFNVQTVELGILPL